MTDRTQPLEVERLLSPDERRLEAATSNVLKPLPALPEHNWEIANSRRKAVNNVLHLLDELAAESNQEGFEP